MKGQRGRSEVTLFKMVNQLRTTKTIKLLLCLVLSVSIICISCNFSQENVGDTREADSIAIRNLLHDAYKWHAANAENIVDFDVIVKDTLQVGIDSVSHIHSLGELKRTVFFTTDFLNNYEKIGWKVDSILKNDTIKYYNEINFGFQDADPWTYFNGDHGNYWDSLKIHKLKITGDTASLFWTINGIKEADWYLVKLKKEGSTWKIRYLRGFDLSEI